MSNLAFLLLSFSHIWILVQNSATRGHDQNMRPNYSMSLSQNLNIEDSVDLAIVLWLEFCILYSKLKCSEWFHILASMKEVCQIMKKKGLNKWSSNIRKTIDLNKQKAHTDLGSKVNNALNTLTWPVEEKTHRLHVRWNICGPLVAS